MGREVVVIVKSVGAGDNRQFTISKMYQNDIKAARAEIQDNLELVTMPDQRRSFRILDSDRFILEVDCDFRNMHSLLTIMVEDSEITVSDIQAVEAIEEDEIARKDELIAQIYGEVPAGTTTVDAIGKNIFDNVPATSTASTYVATDMTTTAGSVMHGGAAGAAAAAPVTVFDDDEIVEGEVLGYQTNVTESDEEIAKQKQQEYGNLDVIMADLDNTLSDREIARQKQAEYGDLDSIMASIGSNRAQASGTSASMSYTVRGQIEGAIKEADEVEEEQVKTDATLAEAHTLEDVGQYRRFIQEQRNALEEFRRGR